MTTILGWILSGITLIGSYVLDAIETAVNALGAALVAAYNAAVALLPSMADAPSLGTGDEWIRWLNWLYPVGDLLLGMTGLVTMWASFLAVRYVLKLVRGL